MMKKIWYILFVAIITPIGTCKSQKIPVGLELQVETLKRVGKSGDNWCITWAEDGSQITSMDDGDWLESGTPYHNNAYKIIGDKDNFERQVISGYPKFTGAGDGWFGFGICSVNGTVYSLVSRTPGESWGIPFTGLKMLKSSDNGKTWYSVNSKGEQRLVSPYDEDAKEAQGSEDMFFYKENQLVANGDTAYPFVFCSFVQSGQNNSKAKDDYVYIYSPEPGGSKLSLARVDKEEVSSREKWQYFSGWQDDEALWVSEIKQRKPVHAFPEKNSNNEYFGWYSWLPSVVWNEGLQLYIMVNGGTYGGYGMTNKAKDYYHPWMHTKTGSLGFWYSENPY